MCLFIIIRAELATPATNKNNSQSTHQCTNAPTHQPQTSTQPPNNKQTADTRHQTPCNTQHTTRHTPNNTPHNKQRTCVQNSVVPFQRLRNDEAHSSQQQKLSSSSSTREQQQEDSEDRLVQFSVTRWAQDPLALGAYSEIQSPDATCDDREICGATEGTVLFAGVM